MEILTAAKEATEFMLKELAAEQLEAVLAARALGASLTLEIAYPAHGVQSVALYLVGTNGERRQLVTTEAAGVPWN